MENLIKESWYNPFFAITEKGEKLEIKNIIIYNQNGVLFESGQGWFAAEHSNNNEIDNINIGAINRKIKVDFSKKENFCIRLNDNYFSNEKHYTLYIYYKNINYKYTGLELNNYWLEMTANILNNTKILCTIGQRQKFVDAVKYNKELEEAINYIKIYNISQPEQVKEKIKTIQKYLKKYEKTLEESKEFTVEDWQKLLFDGNKENITKIIENNMKMEE